MTCPISGRAMQSRRCGLAFIGEEEVAVEAEEVVTFAAKLLQLACPSLHLGRSDALPAYDEIGHDPPVAHAVGGRVVFGVEQHQHIPGAELEAGIVQTACECAR